jgi:hypothetical protein
MTRTWAAGPHLAPPSAQALSVPWPIVCPVPICSDALHGSHAEVVSQCGTIQWLLKGVQHDAEAQNEGFPESEGCGDGFVCGQMACMCSGQCMSFDLCIDCSYVRFFLGSALTANTRVLLLVIQRRFDARVHCECLVYSISFQSAALM